MLRDKVNKKSDMKQYNEAGEMSPGGEHISRPVEPKCYI